MTNSWKPHNRGASLEKGDTKWAGDRESPLVLVITGNYLITTTSHLIVVILGEYGYHDPYDLM
jgi:hypothetical protein